MTRLRVVPLPDGKYLVVFDRANAEDFAADFDVRETLTGCAGALVFRDEVEVP